MMADAMSDIALELARKMLDSALRKPWVADGAHKRCFFCGKSVRREEMTHETNCPVLSVAALLRPHVWAWIPVGERLPEFEEPVWGLLPFEDGKGYALAIVMRGDGEDGWLWHICDEGRMIEWPPTLKLAFECDDDYRVKYWMPLAALPSAPLSLESSNQK